MAALRKIMKVVYANPRKIGHLGIGENLLARFYGNHGLGPLFSPSGSVPTLLDAGRHLRGCRDVRAIVVPLVPQETIRLVLHAQNREKTQVFAGSLH